ncbi:transporter substrate-binding domain-containing protein [Streptococcus pluranimalium]|uniref:transporter substrate-binding domain-containing protein n=1 Tax=Streptococcus pluranimalium TaxID=82348 RepID=UPI00313912D0
MKLKTVMGLYLGFTIIALLGFLLIECWKPQRRTVTLATVGTTKPFSYIKDEVLTGYEIELAREIFKDSNTYQLKIRKTEWSSIFAGIKENNYQMGASSIAMTDERQNYFLYSYATAHNSTVLIANKNSGIKQFKDLTNKRTRVIHGTTTANFWEKYNEENPQTPVQLEYTNESLTSMFDSLNRGDYDFKLFDQLATNHLIKDNRFSNLQQVTVGLPKFDHTPVHYIFSREEKELHHFVNQRLLTLYRDGTMAKLSRRYLVEDNHLDHLKLSLPHATKGKSSKIVSDPDDFILKVK